MLYVRNLTQDFTEERLKEAFEAHGAIQRVKKIKDYAFIHFEERDDAVKAMEALHGRSLHGATLDVSLAKPPSDRKKKEEVLKARERRLLQQNFVQRGPVVGHSGPLVTTMPTVPPFRGTSRPTSMRGTGPVSSQGSASAPMPFSGRGMQLSFFSFFFDT